ncbi:MAG TPA: LysR family transcriptional regulator [Bordetella sp.]|nr:LysR family transcriptional regulator [Bordetella sp.]
MDLRQLRYFVHVAHTRSLTAASAKAWITQSALSRQIKLLEEELGVDLFERQARGVNLTEAGEVLLARASMLLHLADEIKGAVTAVGEQPTGPLHLGAPPSLRQMLVAPVVAQYHAQYPKVRLAVHEGTSKSMRDALAAGDIDIAIVSSLEALDAFDVRPFASELLCWVGPPEAGLDASHPVDISRIAGRPLILTAYPNSLRLIVDRALAQRKLSVEPVMEADMISMMFDLIRRGVGYTVLPYSAVHEPLTQQYVTASPIRGLRIKWVTAQSRERTSTAATSRANETFAAVANEKIVAGEWKTARREVK